MDGDNQGMQKAAKRRRRDSASSSDSVASTSSRHASHDGDDEVKSPSKAFRPSSPSRPLYSCSLAPTCSSTPVTFSTLASLEAHHHSYHAFICHAQPVTFEWAKGKHRSNEDGEDRKCGRVFPSERFLRLHFAECHDPLVQVRAERGEKCLECFDATCGHCFATPKGRRNHMIAKHGYPAQYFFAVTVWGVRDVLAKGGGMVRKDWTPMASQTSEPEELPTQAELFRLALLGEERGVDERVEDLTEAFGMAAISMVPRAVRLAREKTKGKADAAPANNDGSLEKG